MSIWKISLQNIRSKPLYTLLSVLMLSLSITLLLGIQQIKTSFEYQIEHNLGDIDLVIGAKGSPLQLVLSSILHLDNPTGNISYKEVDRFSKNPMIEKTVPVSYGDNYKGYRIVGTTSSFLTFYGAELQEGHTIQKSMEVVLGHTIATQLQLKIGDTFLSSHGLVDNNIHIHHEEFTVVGILKPTQKVIDRLIICNLESVWDVHNHDKHDNENTHNKHEEHEHHEDHGEHESHENHEEHHEEDHEAHDKHEEKEITALLLSFRSPTAVLTLPRQINEDTNMQAALPKYELNKLYEYTGVGINTIRWIAYIILIISGMTIFISLFKMIKERAFDLALMRSYGASHFQLVKMVAYEAIIVICFALLIGLLLTKIGFYILLNFSTSGFQQHILQELAFDQVIHIVGIVFIMAILSIMLAIYPIIKMNISTILSHEK